MLYIYHSIAVYLKSTEKKLEKIKIKTENYNALFNI